MEYAHVSPSAIEVRYKEFIFWISKYREYYTKAFGVKLEIKYDYANLLNSLYWKIYNERVRPQIKDYIKGGTKANRHKVISGIELAIMYIRPIVDKDKNFEYMINANLALFIGKNILYQWLNLANRSKIVKDFEKDHLVWLQLLDLTKSYPLFSNAQTWRLYEELLKIAELVKYHPCKVECVSRIDSNLFN